MSGGKAEHGVWLFAHELANPPRDAGPAFLLGIKMKNFTPHLMSSMGYFTFALNGSAILRPSLALA